jgi:hypothetical protein
MKRFVVLAVSVSSLSALACSATYDGSSSEEVTSDPTCTASECGPAPGVPTKKCADGKVAGPVCVPTGKDTCGWIITQCPDSLSTVHPPEAPVSTVCNVDECGPKPELLEKCPGGEIIGPVCEAKADDKCEWVIPACPAVTVSSAHDPL